MSTMTSPDTILDWLSIRLAPDMSRPRFYNLMERFAAPEDVFAASPREIAAARGFDLKLATGILENRGAATVRAHADRLARNHIRVMTRDDVDYPVNLAQSNLAPPLLFVKGQLLPEDKYSIAMVGSRHATQYGRGVARELSAGLARCGMTIISGFARGVDGEAHNAALKAGGRTIAVLGNGLDVCYPSEHQSLVEKITATGALISEYPLGTPPERFNFPERNHVIAALALGTIVVEAAEKSGSLITARLAVEENRFIFAVPGDITRNNSRGANSLIQQGARMVQRPRDVLFEMKEQLRGYLNEDLLTEEDETAPPQKQRSASAGDNVARPVSPAGKPSQSAAAGNKASLTKRSERSAIDDLLEQAAAEMDPRNAAVTSTDDRTTEAMVTLTRPAPTSATASSKPAASENSSVGGHPVETQPGNTTSRRGAAPNKAVTLTDQEQFIVDLLHHEAMVFDELAEHAFGRGIDVPRLSAILMKLELRQIIRQLPGRYYVLFV